MTVYIYAPCSATECVSVMETMVEQLPDCYADGVNLKEEVLQSLASCDGSSSAVDAFPASSSSFDNQCTNDEVSSLAYLTNSIVTSAECESYAIATSSEWYIAVPCSATTCLTTLQDAVQQMPNCEFEGTNYKEDLSLQQRSCVSSAGSNEASGSANSLTTAAPDGSVNAIDTSSASLHTVSIAGFTLLQVVTMFMALI